MKGMPLEVTEELIARQPPEAQAIIRALLAKIRELQDRLNQSPRRELRSHQTQCTAAVSATMTTAFPITQNKSLRASAI